jgi:hypothetical protein
MTQQANTNIPIIDFKPISVLYDTSAIDKDTLVEKGMEMKKALQSYGFFYALQQNSSTIY